MSLLQDEINEIRKGCNEYWYNRGHYRCEKDNLCLECQAKIQALLEFGIKAADKWRKILLEGHENYPESEWRYLHEVRKSIFALDDNHSPQNGIAEGRIREGEYLATQQLGNTKLPAGDSNSICKNCGKTKEKHHGRLKIYCFEDFYNNDQLFEPQEAEE